MCEHRVDRLLGASTVFFALIVSMANVSLILGASVSIPQYYSTVVDRPHHKVVIVFGQLVSSSPRGYHPLWLTCANTRYCCKFPVVGVIKKHDMIYVSSNIKRWRAYRWWVSNPFEYEEICSQFTIHYSTTLKWGALRMMEQQGFAKEMRSA